LSYSITNLEDTINQAKIKSNERKMRKFTETMEISIGLREIDLKNPANRINIETSLPNQLGKQVKLAMFAEGELAIQGEKLLGSGLTTHSYVYQLIFYF